jgi:signal transduction histidine kinase
VAVSLKDTGVGIAEREVERVFEPSLTTKARGPGLGLSPSRLLVETHGRAVDVQSQEGKGSAPTVTLPLRGS